MTYNADVQDLSINGEIRLYELDARLYGGEIFRFHAMMDWSDWDLLMSIDANATLETSRTLEHQIVYWQGNPYSPLPMEVANIDITSSGKAATVNLTMSNTWDGQIGALSAYCRLFQDFRNCPVVVINTFAKYLDAVNFPNGVNPSASNKCKKQMFYVDQKTSENITQVSFDLTDPMNLTGVKIPLRDISAYCHWALRGGYRSGEGCTYMGSKMFDKDDNPTDDPSKDKCGGRNKSCGLRFENEPRPHGGFVAVPLIKG